GRHIAVLGDMLELGPIGDAEHVALGRLAAQVGVELLVAVGPSAGRLAGRAPGTQTPLVTVAGPGAAPRGGVGTLPAGDAVLVKASRAVGLERVADALVRGAAPA